MLGLFFAAPDLRQEMNVPSSAIGDCKDPVNLFEGFLKRRLASCSPILDFELPRQRAPWSLTEERALAAIAAPLCRHKGLHGCFG